MAVKPVRPHMILTNFQMTKHGFHFGTWVKNTNAVLHAALYLRAR